MYGLRGKRLIIESWSIWFKVIFWSQIRSVYVFIKTVGMIKNSLKWIMLHPGRSSRSLLRQPLWIQMEIYETYFIHALCKQYKYSQNNTQQTYVYVREYILMWEACYGNGCLLYGYFMSKQILVTVNHWSQLCTNRWSVIFIKMCSVW